MPMDKKRVRPKLRFIPFRKKDVVEMCVSTGGFDSKAQMRFREFCELLQSVYHFEYHKKLEALKDSYAPLNPDRDTRKVGFFTDNQDKGFIEGLRELLDKANYEKLSEEELRKAMEDASLFKLRLHIDFEDFEEVLVFARGESFRQEVVRSLMGLRKQSIEFSNFDRVVIYVRFKDVLKTRNVNQKPGSTMLKMFQNVPRADVEMLFPNTRVGMRTIDKLMIGVPAILGGGAILTTKIGPSLILLGTLVGFWLGIAGDPVDLDKTTILALVAGIVGIGSYIWKQFVNFKNRKLTFMQSLMESLYFKNLDNNAGVFHRLVDDAEEEECKEAIIGMYFLLTHPDLTNAEDLDRVVEAWFQDRWDTTVDFEVEDALDKLRELNLITEDAGKLVPVSIEKACEHLDHRWDQYFAFNRRFSVPNT